MDRWSAESSDKAGGAASAYRTGPQFVQAQVVSRIGCFNEPWRSSEYIHVYRRIHAHIHAPTRTQTRSHTRGLYELFLSDTTTDDLYKHGQDDIPFNFC